MLLVIQSTTLDVFATGIILRRLKSGRWKEIPNSPNHGAGFNVIYVDKKQFMRSHVIARCFLAGFPDKGAYISHTDGNRLNANLSNLVWRYTQDRDGPRAKTLFISMTHLFGAHVVTLEGETVHLTLDHTSEHLSQSLKEGSDILLKILRKYNRTLRWLDENRVSL
jgi:hypothetical protein